MATLCLAQLGLGRAAEPPVDTTSMPAPEQGRTDSESNAAHLVQSIGRQHLTQPSRDATITCSIGEGYWRSSIGQAARGELSGLRALSIIRPWLHSSKSRVEDTGAVNENAGRKHRAHDQKEQDRGGRQWRPQSR
jgi:hypothetical protein